MVSAEISISRFLMPGCERRSSGTAVVTESSCTIF